MFCTVCGKEVAAEARFCGGCGSAISGLPTVAVPTAGGGAAQVAPAYVVNPPAVGVYASFGDRLIAMIVDWVLIFLVTCLIIIPFGILGVIGSAVTGGGFPFGGVALFFLLVIPAQWLYFALMESGEMQATFGKRMMGLKVTDDRGQRISFGRATARYFMKHVSSYIMFIGYLMAAFTEKKQALHDLVASTLVLKA